MRPVQNLHRAGEGGVAHAAGIHAAGELDQPQGEAQGKPVVGEGDGEIACLGADHLRRLALVAALQPELLRRAPGGDLDLGGSLRPFAFPGGDCDRRERRVLAGVGEKLDDEDARVRPGVDAVALLDLAARLTLAAADRAAIELAAGRGQELDARFRRRGFIDKRSRQ